MTKAKSIFILGMRYTQRNLANEIISSLCSQRVLYTYEYEVGVIMINFVLQRRLLSSVSSSRTATFHPDRRAHLSGSPWGCWPPGHLSRWPAGTWPPDSCRRSVPQLEDTRLRVGGRMFVDGPWRGWTDPRGSGSSAVVQSDPIRIFSDTGFVRILIIY